MPLKNSDLQTIPPDPDVKIYLHGQLILEPGDDGECTVGINRCSPAHQVSFEVRQRMQDPDAPDIILLRQLGRLESDVEIDLDPPTSEGVTRFVPDVPFGQVTDFRWLIDLGGRNFHDCKVVFNGSDTEPGVIIREGLLYTAARTDETKLQLTRTNGGEGKPALPLGSVAAIVGVNIYLKGKKLKVSFVQDNDEKHLILPPPDAPANVKCYEIRVTNDPPFVNFEDAPDHDELREFYKAVKNLEINGVDVEDFPRFKLNVHPIKRPGLGSPTIPCMPIGGGTDS